MFFTDIAILNVDAEEYFINVMEYVWSEYLQLKPKLILNEKIILITTVETRNFKSLTNASDRNEKLGNQMKTAEVLDGPIKLHVSFHLNRAQSRKEKYILKHYPVTRIDFRS